MCKRISNWKYNKIKKKKETDADSLEGIKKYKKIILKTQERILRQKHNVFTEEIKKIALSSNNDEKSNQLIQ